MMIAIRSLLFVLCACAMHLPLTHLSAMTIAEKKAIVSRDTSDLDPDSQDALHKINEEHAVQEGELHTLYAQVIELHSQNAPECRYQELIGKIKELKNSLSALDQKWKQLAAEGAISEDYALWQQPDTSLEQLVMDYGSHDYVYLIPPSVGMIKLSIASNLPIPRSSWTEMLDLILTKNGVGIRQLNSYLRELYLLPTSQSGISLITNKRADLSLFPTEMRIAYMLSPEVTDVRRVWFFLDKFTNHQSIALQQIGRDIMIVGTVGEINDLLKLYDFVAANRGEKEHKLISLSRADPEEMAHILTSIFDQEQCQSGALPEGGFIPSCDTLSSNGLQIMVLNSHTHALFLVGTREEISKAERIINEVESQLCTARDKVVYWYTAKHSDAEEMASVLARIYALMVVENTGAGNGNGAPPPDTTDITVTPGPVPPPPYHEPFFQEGSVAINPAPATLLPETTVFVDENRQNFIVDAKTGSIVMVVKAEFLPKIKELIKKLDVPKKMVQIEVLLVEKKLTNTSNYGLNLLKIGCGASNTHQNGFSFSDQGQFIGRGDGHGGHDGRGGHGGQNLDFKGHLAKGLTEFIISRGSCGLLPAFDMIYNFLISQDEIQINACPSVTTINQTPARIVVVEETSINTGIVEVPTTGQVALKDSFTRAQYGITLEITPTIHIREESDGSCFYEDDGPDYITLQTNVNFDTIQPTHHAPNRPNVTRRSINNEVMIPDGQTVILGGLRRKNTHDGKESIPFLGEIPGIGKLFSETQMNDSSTEMFIFITPKIIYDPVEDLERIKMEELNKRPGDLPEFLLLVESARQHEKERLLSATMRILFGRESAELYPTVCGEYDGR
jgi:general secretion pathway protein D